MRWGPFDDSKVVKHEDVAQLVRFLRETATKIAKTSKSTLQELMREMDDYNPSVKKAIDYLDDLIELPDDPDT